MRNIGCFYLTDGEVEALKKTINDLIKSGQEKDRKISELRKGKTSIKQ